MHSDPLYLNWSFWSAVLALVAIAVSTGPPAWRWLRPPRLDLELFERIAVTHKVGNPLLQARVVVRNVGGREVRVTSITAHLSRDGGEAYALSGQGYLQTQSGPPLLFVPFTLKGNDEWGNVVNFFKHLSREEEQRYREHEYALRAHIIQRIHAFPAGTAPGIIAEEQLVTPLIQMYERNPIRWLAGQYELLLTAKTTNKNVKAERRYRFTIFETDAEQLRKLTDDYKTGAGIYFDNVERNAWINPIIEQVDQGAR